MTEKAQALFREAEQKRAASRFTDAVPLYLEAKRLAPLDKELRADCAFSLGDTFRMVGDFSLAGRCYREAHRLSLYLDDEVRALDSLVGLGLSLRARGEYKEALTLFKKCLKGYQAMGDNAGVAFTLWAEAGVWRFKGELKRAVEGFKESKKIFQRLKDRSGVSYCLTGLGGTSRVCGLHKDSLKYYREANKMFRGLKDTFGLAYSYCGIANAMRMSGDFKGSLEYFRLAKTNYKRIGDRVSYAYTLWGEGTSLQMLGRDKQAARDFDAARKLFKETKDRRGAIYCLLSTGQLEFRKDPGKGVSVFKRARKRAEALGLKVEAGYARELVKRAAGKPEDIPMNIA